MTNQLDKFIKDQLSVWPLAAANFRAAKNASERTLKVYGIEAKVQHNPCRIGSSTAETDERAIAARPCFLCLKNRQKEQFHIRFEGRKHRNYRIQINPFPIFPKHLVIVREEHIAQAIWHHLPDMLEFGHQYQDFTVFYNGPESGASAPDHLHFQACPRGFLPLEVAVDSFLDACERGERKPLATNKDAELYEFDGYTNGVFALRARTSKSLTKLFYRLLCCCEAEECEIEPPFNLFNWCSGEEYRAFVVMRSARRSHHYYSTGPDHLTMSPGAADVAGYFVAPRLEDFDKVTSGMLEDMLREVAIDDAAQETICRRLTRPQEMLDVEVAREEQIRFEIISDGAGPQRVRFNDGRIAYNGMLYDELYFDAVTRSTLFAEPSFIIYGDSDAEPRKYAGGLHFVVNGDKIVAVNHIGVENYVLSVLAAGEDASEEQLCENAVEIRRNALEKTPYGYYPGINKPASASVRRAVDRTWGLLRKSLGALALLLSIAAGARVKTGVEVLRDSGFEGLQGKRVGLVTNPTGVDSELRSTVDILAAGVNLVALYAPEHGIRGDVWAGDKVRSDVDAATGLPVYSLYGATRQPAPEMLDGVDVMVYDIQDIGCRSYTFISTLGLVMRACAERGIPVVVLDRPNPLGGLKIEGPCPEEGFYSFVGQYRIPYIYGMTVGELALLINEEGLNRGQKGDMEPLKCELRVVKMKGWTRGMLFADTGLPWVPTSPNVPYPEVALCYPASGLCGELHGYLQVGVGYTLPFGVFAAEWIDADALKDRLDSYSLPGVCWRTIHYRPFSGSCAGKLVHGVQMHFTDFAAAEVTMLQFHVMRAVYELYGRGPLEGCADRLAMFNKVCGTDRVAGYLASLTAISGLNEFWMRDVDAFRALSLRYHLY